MAQLCLSRGSFVSHETMCDVGVPFACCIQSLHYVRGGNFFLVEEDMCPFSLSIFILILNGHITTLVKRLPSGTVA